MTEESLPQDGAEHVITESPKLRSLARSKHPQLYYSEDTLDYLWTLLPGPGSGVLKCLLLHAASILPNFKGPVVSMLPSGAVRVTPC